MANGFDVNWLMGYQEKRQTHGNKPLLKPRGKATKTTKTTVAQLAAICESPHWKALQYLAKNPGKLKGNQEHYDQVRIFWHFEQHDQAIYKRLHATPNGGLRHAATAGKMKAEGQKKGYPDTTLDMPRGVYHGLRLELKHGKNTLSEEQILWLNQLRDDGYYCVVCYGDKEAIDAITHYAALEAGQVMPAHINDHLWIDLA